MVRNGAVISLAHWEMDRYLHSHNVASPTNVRNYEVSGFTNFSKKSKTEVLKEVKSVICKELTKFGLDSRHQICMNYFQHPTSLLPSLPYLQMISTTLHRVLR